MSKPPVLSEIELRQLRYFSAVAELLSFGKAAKVLHVSQPPLSRQVRSLERSIGAVLLNRSPSGVTLTPAGAQFFGEVQRVLRRIQSAAELARRTEEGQAGNLSVGCSEYLDVVLRRFLPQQPSVAPAGLQLRFESLAADEQVQLLRHCALDAGVVRLPLPDIDQLSIDVLGREPIMALVSDEHPYATRPQISLRDLAGKPILLMRRKINSPVKDQIRRICDEADLTTEVVESREPVVELLDSVRQELRVALVPASMSYAQLPGVTFLPIQEPHASIGIGLLYRRDDNSPALARFLAAVHRVPHDFVYRGPHRTLYHHSQPVRQLSA